MTSHLPFTDIQANILKPHNRNYSCFLFCRWQKGLPADDYRAWVKTMGEVVGHYEQQHNDYKVYQHAFATGEPLPQTFVNNLGLSYAAYKWMDSAAMPTDFEFKKGMHNRRYLPDYYGRKTADLVGEFIQNEHHALICIAHDSEEAVLQLKEELSGTAIFKKVVAEQLSEFIKQRRDTPTALHPKGQAKGPFDFRDDISKPSPKVEEADNYQFAFEANRDAAEPCSHGTYLAVQKIICHVTAFTEYAQGLRDAIDPNLSLSKAKSLLIGRFPNGTPLDLYPGAQKTESARNTNHFDYHTNDGQTPPDPLGKRCPLHAHTRSVNPRHNGQLLKPVIRRGISFTDKRSRKQILMFQSYQASIIANLRPLYDNMLRGRFNDHQLDALVYQPQQDFLLQKRENSYWVDNGSATGEWRTYPAGGHQLTTFLGSAFYYCPSISYLKSPY